MSPRRPALIPKRRTARTDRVRKLKKYVIGSQKPRLLRRYIKSNQLGPKDYSKLLSDFHANQNRLKNTGIRPSDSAVDKKAKSEHPFVAEKLTSVSNPTPDTGVILTHAQLGYGYPLANPTPTAQAQNLSSLLAVTTSSKRASPTGFSALPPLAFLSDPTGQSTSTATRSFSQRPTATDQPQSAQPYRFDTAVIVLLAVGAALALLAGCIVIKICLLPRRQPRPTHSSPVLKDEAEHDSYATSEADSPIFGGKERLSPMPGSAGPMWTWVQYPRPTVQPMTNEIPLPDENAPHSSDLPYQQQDSTGTQTIPPQLAYNPSRQSTIRQTPPATSRTTNRLSSTSMYLYSPRAAYASIGLAISSLPEEMSDAHDVIKHSKSKTSNKRKSQSGSDDGRRDSAKSYSGLAYDEVDTPTPNPGVENRARVKSGYFAAGTYPRISTPNTTYSIATATKVKIGQRNSFIKGPGGHPLQRSDSKRLRDTQALTHALGLTSPRTDYIVPSPQESLYPDDSMNIGDVRHCKSTAPAAQQLPNEYGSKALVTMEVGASQISCLARDGSMDNSDSMECTAATSGPPPLPSRNTDKLPRVPPLPSLTQMGLAHNNPEGYTNYRSPTYSIYGLYGRGNLGQRG